MKQRTGYLIVSILFLVSGIMQFYAYFFEGRGGLTAFAASCMVISAVLFFLLSKGVIRP